MREFDEFEITDPYTRTIEPVYNVETPPIIVPTVETISVYDMPLDAPIETPKQPISVFDTSLDTPVIEPPKPVISDPANWVEASKDLQSGPYESDLPWNPAPADTISVYDSQPVNNSPSYVFSKDENTVINYPKELEPAYVRGIDQMPFEPVYQSPIFETPTPIFQLEPVYDKGLPIVPPLDYEVPKMQAPPQTCECFAYPCNCGDGGFIDTPPVVEPPPVVDPPLVTPTPVLPIDTPVTSPPPVINVTVQTQTPTVQNAGAAADDGETTLIFGYPWYYVAGAAAAGLFLLSSMDGKK